MPKKRILVTYFIAFMKLSCITLLTLLSMAGTLLAHKSEAQQTSSTVIQFKSKNIALEEVLQTIQAQSDFNLIYSPSQINGQIVVELPQKRTTLDVLLQYLAETAALVPEVNKGNIYINRKQQPGRLAGFIKDTEGNPLIGASVSLLGTNNGTMTKEDGSFALQAYPGTYTLRVSYIGYET